MDSLFSGYIPPIIDDICVSKDEFGGKVKYFMSSDKKSQYFKLNAAQYNFFAEFIPYALKERDSLKLDRKCREISEGKISLNVICQMLQRYNLFDDDKGIKTKVTIDLNSKKFLEIPLEKLNRKRNVWKACFNVVCIISVLIIMMSLAGLILYREHIINELSNMKFSIENVDLKSLIAIAFISALAIVLHESGHLLMAQKLGIEWKSINVSFIWGISPIFYVRYKNFCIHKSKEKIKVLLMGTFMNFIQVLMYLILCLSSDSWVFMIGALVNIGCIISCILPIGTSDGYQVLAIMLGIEGARWKALTMIGQVIKNPKKMNTIVNKREDMFLISYILLAYIISIWGCVGLLKSILHFFNLLNVSSIHIFILVIFFFGFITVLNMAKFIKNVASIK